VVLLGLGRYAAYIPLSVLAGILLTVGIGIIDYRGLRHLVHVPRPDAVVLVLVLVITVFGNLLHAVGVGVVLACILFMKMSGDLAEKGTSSGTLAQSEEVPWRDEREVMAKFGEHVLINHLYGPLFFGFTHRFQEMLKKLDPEIAVLIIRMDRVPHIDQSGMYALEEALLDLKSRRIVVILSGIAPQPLDMLRRIEIVPKLVPEENIFQDFGLCKEYLLQFFEENKD
jgi:SulP family sulfate permease